MLRLLLTIITLVTMMITGVWYIYNHSVKGNILSMRRKQKKTRD
ncbi:hypothetical protein [Metabacillus litoralis]|nr:hypothetical protein [Metabacillus litoralis]